MRLRPKLLRKAPKSIYKDHVPGQLTLSSDALGWRSLSMYCFDQPQYLLEGPTPPIPAYAFGLTRGGDVQGEAQFGGGKWIPQTSHAGLLTFVPAECSFNARWYPCVEEPFSVKTTTATIAADLMGKYALEALNIDSSRIELTGKFVEDRFLEQLMVSLEDELRRGNPLGTLYADTATQMLSIHVLSRYCAFKRRITPYKNGLSKVKLQRVLDYMHSHFNEEISLESLSGLVGMSSYHFLRLFKISTGLSPLKYIIKLRMEAAERLLRDTGLSVFDIAFKIGYGAGTSHFIALFRQYYGVSPRSYRHML